MQRKVITVLVFIILTLLSESAATELIDSTSIKSFTQSVTDPDKAKLYIYGDWSKYIYYIYVDSVLIGKTVSGVYFYLELIPGMHTISAETESGEISVMFQAEGGKNYFAKQSTITGISDTGADIEIIDEEVGKKEVLSSNLVEQQKFVHRGYTQEDTGVNAQYDQIDVIVGFGYIFSWDYNEVLKDTYSSYDFFGGWGWLDLQLGVRVKTSERFSITPSVDLLFNYVSLPNKIFFNTIVLPAISFRYAFKATPSFYLSGEVNYGIYDTGGSIKAESGGIGFSGTIGYAYGSKDFQFGYLYVPVEVYSGGNKNFGGIFIKYGWSF